MHTSCTMTAWQFSDMQASLIALEHWKISILPERCFDETLGPSFVHPIALILGHVRMNSLSETLADALPFSMQTRSTTKFRY